MKPSRTQLWLESLGDWSWPGQGGAAAVELLPPAWVPAFPPRRQAAVAPGGTLAAPGPWARASARTRRLALAALLGLLAATAPALVQGNALSLPSVLHGERAAEQEQPAIGPQPAVAQLPTLEPVSEDAAGSSILRADFSSAALAGEEGSFLVYLPPGYAATAQRFPVIYLLPGEDQSDEAFLSVGLQADLDRLIATHAIPPVMAVMIQGGPGANLWRDQGSHHYQRYVLEVQQLVDKALATVPKRDARAIVGDSMGGYGAMNTALSNPLRFGVVESWIGFFDGLEGTLRADRPVIRRLGLRAFVYGAAEDHIANPAEDLPFAAALRAAGARAEGAVYPGEHNLQTVEAHLESTLAFAGRALRVAQRGHGGRA
ncbi:MAG TPA: alpha/beta hydrolase-fold protein [Solirubrobacteraceae bacterium]|nr:alpha/beta hydrolase-fold protein [Solirubrobacteraceae bacterium]